MSKVAIAANNPPTIYKSVRGVGLFRLSRRRDLNLNGLNVVGVCDVHGDYS
jgi:hypothetical protein